MPPKLPDFKLPPSPLTPLRSFLLGGRVTLKQACDDVRSLAHELVSDSPERPATSTVARVRETTTAVAGVSNQDTLKYQLDLLLDDLQHLETEHLPAQGRIAGSPCDCIAKAGRSLRRHATETIPIAARQGEDAKSFSDIAKWAQHLMDIGTLDKVQSGRYDDEYLEASGTASTLRKRVETMFSGLGGDGECKPCEEARASIRQFVEQRKKITGGGG